MATKTPVAPRRPRPVALARAQHGEAPVHLTATESRVFGEALRRGEDLREGVESLVSAYGRWLLEAVFDDDASAALDDKSKNPVWLELVRRAGGPTLGIGKTSLYTALRIAAHDKRISDQAWRRLDSGRKGLLLPLATEDPRASDQRLREAAQHVSKFNLSWTSTTEYVAQVLAEGGGKPRAVRLTVGRLTARMQDFRKTFGSAALLRRVDELRSEAEPADRERAAREIEQLRDVLLKLAKALRTRA
jgi:hypothetical protein